MRRIYVKRTEHIDNETGEVTHSEEHSSFFVKSRHFVKMYLDHLHLLKDLTSGARVVLDLILIEMEFNENTVYINKRDREQIGHILDKAEHTIRNYIYELEGADIIAKVGTNTYKVNPNLFQKGGKNDDKVYEAHKPHNSNGKSPL